MRTTRLLFVYAIFSVSASLFGIAYAEQFTATNYGVFDSVINSGGYGSSASFTLSGSIGEVGNGTSTSSSFGVNAGFLHFPLASTPVLSITTGDSSASLSWTASTGYLGWTAAGYDVAQATAAGGPYSYTSVGSSLSATQTGLTGGTRYYFVVVAKDGFGNAIASSTESSVLLAGTSSSGGGGAGGVTITETQVLVSGKASPEAIVTLLRDGQPAATATADANADFQITLSGITAGNYVFGLYGEDRAGRRSAILSFPVTAVRGTTTAAGPFFLAPTAEAGKSGIEGMSVPGAEILIAGISGSVDRVKAGSDGAYTYPLSPSASSAGKRGLQAKASAGGAVSPFSRSVGERPSLRGDFNKDEKIDIVDFSIMSYWYKKPLAGPAEDFEKKDFNGDGVIDLVDLSIMVFYWTG